jgi:pyridoxine 5-phosphate synthase
MQPNVSTSLSVNVNKVALLRNTRNSGIPSVVRAAHCCLEAGAQGITVHPRPDERHIRTADVHDLASLLAGWPQAEFNIEGNPLHNLMDIIRQVKPHQATFVPDSVSQKTSDHGWQLESQGEELLPLIRECHDLGVRVSLFMDPEPSQMELARHLGADRIELYTESWAVAFASQQQDRTLERFAATARQAVQLGLGVNAGHDLNLLNLTPFLSAVRGVAEVSIGHAFVSDALEMGYERAVGAYLNCIRLAA